MKFYVLLLCFIGLTLIMHIGTAVGQNTTGAGNSTANSTDNSTAGNSTGSANSTANATATANSTDTANATATANSTNTANATATATATGNATATATATGNATATATATANSTVNVNGSLSVGQPAPASAIFDPSELQELQEAVCGNGDPEAGEECDGEPCCTSTCQWAKVNTPCAAPSSANLTYKDPRLSAGRPCTRNAAKPYRCIEAKNAAKRCVAPPKVQCPTFTKNKKDQRKGTCRYTPKGIVCAKALTPAQLSNSKKLAAQSRNKALKSASKAAAGLR
jgi:hypothetical protein